MPPIVKVQLDPMERSALEKMASQNYRRPSEELRFLVMQEARRRGLLTDPPAKSEGCAAIDRSTGAAPHVQS